MRKYHAVLHEVPTAAPVRRTRLPAILGLLALTAAFPFLYEGALLVVARWRSMTGAYWEPRTPALDALREWSRLADVELHTLASRVLQSGPWSPSLAVPVAIGWAVVMAAAFLRRVR
jgi:hypothetical protein